MNNCKKKRTQRARKKQYLQTRVLHAPRTRNSKGGRRRKGTAAPEQKNAHGDSSNPLKKGKGGPVANREGPAKKCLPLGGGRGVDIVTWDILSSRFYLKEKRCGEKNGCTRIWGNAPSLPPSVGRRTTTKAKRAEQIVLQKKGELKAIGGNNDAFAFLACLSRPLKGIIGRLLPTRDTNSAVSAARDGKTQREKKVTRS